MAWPSGTRSGDELASGRADHRVRRGGADLNALEHDGRADLSRWPGMRGRIDQLRVSYIYKDKFLARRGIGPVGLPARSSIGHARDRPSCYWRAHPHVTAVSVAAISVLGVIGTGCAYALNYQIITAKEPPSPLQ
jgi:hypothetical protein